MLLIVYKAKSMAYVRPPTPAKLQISALTSGLRKKDCDRCQSQLCCTVLYVCLTQDSNWAVMEFPQLFFCWYIDDYLSAHDV